MDEMLENEEDESRQHHVGRVLENEEEGETVDK